MSENQVEEQEPSVREQDKYLPTANIARIMKKVRVWGGGGVCSESGANEKIGASWKCKGGQGRKGHGAGMCIGVCELHHIGGVG